MKKSLVIASLAEHESYRTSLERFDKWLKRTEQSIENQTSISVVPEEINNQATRIKVFEDFS